MSLMSSVKGRLGLRDTYVRDVNWGQVVRYSAVPPNPKDFENGVFGMVHADESGSGLTLLYPDLGLVRRRTYISTLRNGIERSVLSHCLSLGNRAFKPQIETFDRFCDDFQDLLRYEHADRTSFSEYSSYVALATPLIGGRLKASIMRIDTFGSDADIVVTGPYLGITHAKAGRGPIFGDLAPSWGVMKIPVLTSGFLWPKSDRLEGQLELPF